MAQIPDKRKPVPVTKTARLGGLAGLLTSVAGNVLKNTSKQLLSGQKPSLKQSLFAADNAVSIADKLAHMRGAAMKVGQLLAMDAGDILPPAWEPILSRLRQGADHMPQAQLLKILVSHWGEYWHDQFRQFELQPIAAASIGQVHRAQLWDHTFVAIKVQYPGVKQSIDSDIDSIAWLIKHIGVLPAHIDLSSLLTQAKAQLHDEADYDLEAKYIGAYTQLISDSAVFVLPMVHLELSSDTLLTMSFIDGEPLESVQVGAILKGVEITQTYIDDLMSQLLMLCFRELFEFRLLQSDPNFANYLYLPETQQIALLDFGATQPIAADTSDAYRALAMAMLNQSRSAILVQLQALGLVDAHMSKITVEVILDGCMLASEALQSDSYDIKGAKLVKRLQAITAPLVQERDATATPDFAVAMINRKVTGLILLANRLGARLDLAKLLAPYHKQSD